jgi:hypothetical protein
MGLIFLGSVNKFKACLKSRQIIQLTVGKLFEGLRDRFSEQFSRFFQNRIKTVPIGIN